MLQVHRVSKSFGAVRALQDVSFALQAGEVHALMGENGAGKSTLMKVLAGLHAPDAGEIELRGRPVTVRNPHDAIRKGIAMIHQELLPVPDMTVAENILLGQEPAMRFCGWIDRRAMAREAQRLLGLLGVALPVTRRMRELSVAEMQTVEIARALGHNADIVIMDEPTSAISDREVDALFAAIRALTQRGVAVIYVSHKMDEVFRIADRVTVLRDGAYVGTYPIGELDEQRLIALMVGRELRALLPKDRTPHGSPTRQRGGPAQIGPPAPNAQADGIALEVRGLGRMGAFRDISFSLRRGEILGLAGLMGAGRTELVSAIGGLVPADVGEILIDGEPARIRCVADALRHGIGLVTEDRQEYGLVPSLSVKHNLTLASLRNCCRGPLIDHAAERDVAERAIATFAIKASSGNQPVNQLSGGNQQKVVIAKTLLASPSIVILDEPTRGIDIGAKAEVYAIIRRLASEGKSVIMVSSELPEILLLSDRILVLRQGTLAAELDPSRTSQEEILKYAMPV